VTNATTLNTLNVTGAATIGGDLNIGGTLSYISTEEIQVTDKVVQLASSTGDAALLNNGGIRLGTGSAQASLLYNSTTNNWTSNKGLTLNGQLIQNGGYAAIAYTNAGNYIEMCSGPSGPTYIDFHSSNSSANVDFSARIACYSDNQMYLDASSFTFNNPVKFGQRTGQHLNLFDVVMVLEYSLIPLSSDRTETLLSTRAECSMMASFNLVQGEHH
jgi:hypothetical protein